MKTIRLSASQTHPICPATFVVQGKAYANIRIPYHPIYELCQTIELKAGDAHIHTLMKVLSGQLEDVQIFQSQAVKKLAKKHFGVELDPDSKDLARTLITMLVGQTIDVSLLDSLRTDTICEAMEHAYDKLSHQNNEKVQTNVDKYLQTSKKLPHEKEKIKTIKQSKPRVTYRQKVEDDARDKRREDRKYSSRDQQQGGKNSASRHKKHYVQKKQERGDEGEGWKEDDFEDFREKRKAKRESKYGKELAPINVQDLQNYQTRKKSPRAQGKSPRNHDRYYEDEDKQKPKDPRITLGIAGDTLLGWRQRTRPIRLAVPSS